jgi:proteic killer suppression protein
MIRTFRDRETQLIASRHVSKHLPQDIQRKARMKLALIEAATEIEDLRVPPGNRLEALKGDRAGQYLRHPLIFYFGIFGKYFDKREARA